MALLADNAASDAPPWLLPLVVTLHVGGGLALLTTATPVAAPAIRSLEIALLAPAPRTATPTLVPPKPQAQPPRPILRTTPETRPEPSPTPSALVAAPAPVPPPPSAVAAETKPAPQADAAATVTPPRFDAAYLNNPRPAYPPLARRMGEEGRTVLRVLVSAEGAAENVELRQSAGSPRLDEAAIEAVKRWRFVPARQGERTIAAWVLVPLVFKLEN